MKILVLSNKNPFPPRDGGELAIRNMIQEMVEYGHEVSFLMMTTSKHHKKNSPDIDSINAHNVFVNTEIRQMKLLWNYFFGSMPYIAKRFVDTTFAERLIDLLYSKRFDVVQLEGLYLTPYIDTIRQVSQAKIVLRAHNVEHEIWQRNSELEKNPLKRLYLKSMAKRLKIFELQALLKIDGLLPITDRDEEKLRDLGYSKLSLTIPFGIKAKNYQIKPLHIDKISVGYIGALDWFPNREGLMWFLENVWQKIRMLAPELEFHIAGRNADMELKRLINSFSSVQFHGEVESAQDFIQEHPVMVVPLFSGSGMRVKIIEGMLLNRAMIVTPIASEGISVSDGENILIAGNPETFIDKLLQLIKSPEKITQIGEAAHRFAMTNYDNHRLMENLTTFYKSLK
ncbi:MAG: glycosyltransferase [Bacteroidales bacterium]|nr:glycosyltransferase [Bacteroidales bacterium]